MYGVALCLMTNVYALPGSPRCDALTLDTIIYNISLAELNILASQQHYTAATYNKLRQYYSPSTYMHQSITLGLRLHSISHRSLNWSTTNQPDPCVTRALTSSVSIDNVSFGVQCTVHAFRIL